MSAANKTGSRAGACAAFWARIRPWHAAIIYALAEGKQQFQDGSLVISTTYKGWRYRWWITLRNIPTLSVAHIRHYRRDIVT